MKSKVFLDANVIIHWILLKKIKERKDLKKLKGLKIWKRYEKLKPSFDLLEKIKEGLDNFKFFVSDLCIAEIYSGVLDEHICNKMFEDGIPLSRWSGVKHSRKFNLKDEDVEEIKGSVSLLLEENFGLFNKKNKKRIKVINPKPDFVEFPYLVLKNKLRTHDAFLIHTAISEDCQFFITEDNKLKKKSKSISKIRAILPSTFLQDMING